MRKAVPYEVVRRFLAGLVVLVAVLSGSAATAATLDWATRPATDLLTATDSATVSGVTITTHTVPTGNFDATTIAQIQPGTSANGSNPGIIVLGMDAQADDESDYQTTTFTFTPAVYNVSLTVRDIDGGTACACWNDIIDFNSSGGLPTSWQAASGVTYNSSTGRASANQNVNVGDETGNITVTWSGPITSLTIVHRAGAMLGTPTNPSYQAVNVDDIVFSTVPTTASLKLQKITTNGTGTFSFTQTNLASTPGNISTFSNGTAWPTTPVEIPVNTLGTAITLTETAPAGFRAISASCIDTNSSVTGNTGTFGTLAGSVLTVPAANVVANARFVCTFTNARATVTLQKITQGSTGGAFTFADTNIQGTFAGITTTAVGTAQPVPGETRNITTIGSQVILTETMPATFRSNGATCTDANSAVTGNTPTTSTTNTITIPAARVTAGAVYTCVFTNSRIPTVRVQKITVGGVGGPYSFTQTNLASTPAAITTTTANTATPAAPTAINVNTIGTAVTITEGATPVGFTLTNASCTDSNSAITGNTGAVGTLSGSTLTIPAANVVAGAVFTCIFTNTRATVSVQKITNGAVGGPFTFTQTNLASTPANITTTSAGTAQPASPTAINVATLGTAVTLTEGVASGYTTGGVVCTDANSATTGNGPVSSTTTSITIPAANVKAGSAYNCVFTNNRQPNLQLAKAWGANSIVSDAVSIGASSGGTNNTAAFSATGGTAANSGAAVTISVGNTITLPAETFTSGLAANYTTTLACTADGGATANPLSGTNGQVANTLVIGVGDAGKAIVCTYTNTRKSTTFRLAKAWGVNSITGDVASLGATTGLITNTALFTSTASTDTNGTFVTVYAGETATLPAETMTTGTLANYTTVVACSAGTLTGTDGQVAGNTLAITAASTASAITCTYTNTRKSATLTLAKTWSNGTVGHTATVTSSGFINVASSGLSTSSGNNTTTGSSVIVFAGESGTISESGSNMGSYLQVLACSGNATPLSGSTLTINPVDTAITCTYTNTLAVPAISVTKTPSVGSVSAAGEVITYTIAVANTGNVDASSITVSDPLGSVSCPGGNPIPTLAVSASVNCTLVYTVPQSVLDSNGGGDGDIDNTATANGTTAYGNVNQSAFAVVTLTGGATLGVVKQAYFPAGAGGDVNGNGTADAGDIITYRYDVTNSGNRTVTGITVNDIHNAFGSSPAPDNPFVQMDVAPAGDSTDVAGDNSFDSLAPGDTIRFTWAYTVVQQDVDQLQ